MRTTVPVAASFLAGLVLALSFLFRDDSAIGVLGLEFKVWTTIIGGFTLVLGVVSIVRVNWKTVAGKRRDWPYKILTLIAVFITGIPVVLPSSWSPLFGQMQGSIYDWLFNQVQAPMMGTMFATLAFYIASAAYRAFRARSIEATLLLLTAVLIMMWRVPMGELLLNMISPKIAEFLNTYIMNGANMAVQRGIIIGAALGAASMSLRLILGIERTYMGKG